MSDQGDHRGDEVDAFDVCGSLPRGVTVLEASAGTGKTFAIAALAARYVATGTPLEALLLVTFTRMATGELRERVRERLVSAEHSLGLACAGIPVDADDDVLALLADGSPQQVELRRRRLAAALADFDAATIATTHGFCQHILASLGVAGDVESDVTFLEDPRDLVDEVVTDLYVRRFHGRADAPLFDLADARRIGQAAVANPLAPLEPRDAPPDSAYAMRWRLACAVRDEVDRRKRRMKVLTYDDLLTRLVTTLRDPARGPAACRRLRERYRVALVDEFQDTDPVQWEIMERAFAREPSTLVLIGDPKQAIYAFRGADVYAYLTAARQAGTKKTLGINWRSDQGLIDAYDTLFTGTTLGHRGIAYRTVRAADANQQPRLDGASQAAPLRVRVVHRADGLVGLTDKTRCVSKASGEAHIAADLAADVVALLHAGTQVLERDARGAETGREPVRPGHVAVLVRTNRQAALIRDALDALDVPAVINGAGSVFATPVARQWLALLEALERPTSPVRIRAAALTCFLGWRAAEVATAGEAAWENVHARLHRWAGVLRRRGIASLLELVTLSERLPGRMLARVDGERELTDLRHIGQLLHAEAVTERLGVTALTAWLRRRIAEADADTTAEDRSRRLESDAEAVQVLTIHRSKGLEFPIVYYPYLWQPGPINDDDPPVFHDPDHDDERTINVGMGGPGFRAHRQRHRAEQRGEDLRLAYVALTRARHQAIVWWAGSYAAGSSPLGRLLFARQADGTVPPEGGDTPDDDEALERFAALADAAPGCVAVERTAEPDDTCWRGQPARTAKLAVRRFDRRLDHGWRRASYSAITAAAYEPRAAGEARVASEPETDRVADEALPPAPGSAGTAAPGPEAGASAGGDAGEGHAAEGDAAEATRLRAVPCPLGAMPGGAEIGTFVHAVLERTDFTADDLDADLAARVREQLAWRHLDVGDPDAVVAGLRAAIDTPLGTLAGEVALRDVARADRLDELHFDLPLVGGDTPTATLTVAAIAEVLRAHLPAGDVLAGYPDRLADPVLARDLRGYLAGSIDLLLRVRADDGTPQFTVVDYKTNWLGVDGEDLTAWHYRPAALADAMVRGHYPLQALLYAVAAHRYLRWRLPGYRPEGNLAGIAYLFVRGMTGADVPRVDGRPCGVFAWQPPAGLVEALSDLFDRGPS
ncbi:MAG TPA: UvrD-helicase domain-containing protein [Egibacteraceae bacterium]|nr:UvrD-helicase domain-containing protein [Egibacteraceae bacterium]